MMAAVIPNPSLDPGEGDTTALMGGPPSATCRSGCA